MFKTCYRVIAIRQRHESDTPETLDGRRSVQNIKILGIAFTSGLSVALHIQQLVTLNVPTLYALKKLGGGLYHPAIQAVFRSVVLARFLYASPARWGFATVHD